MPVQCIYREPFSIGSPQVFQMKHDESIETLVRMAPLPPGFPDAGVVKLNGETVPRAMWGVVRPKPDRVEVPVVLTFHMAPRGGDGGDGKDIMLTIAALALTIATGFITAGGLETLLGSAFAPGTIGATALAAGVSIVGSLLLNGIGNTPAQETTGPDTAFGERETPASLSGNILAPNSPIPRVIGTRQIHPPLMTEPRIFYQNNKEVVEAIYGLAGPHALTDIRVNGTPVSLLPDVTTETREGWDTDTPLTLVTKQFKTTSAQTELSAPEVDNNDQALLVSGSASFPKEHTFRTGLEPDWFEIHLMLPRGLSKNADATKPMRIPFRIRLQSTDGLWVLNLPELHYSAASLREERLTVRVVFADGPPTMPKPPTENGWVAAFVDVPDATVAPYTGEYHASSAFGATGSPSSVTYHSAANHGSQIVKNVDMGSEQNTVILYVTPGGLPLTEFDLLIKRGTAVDNTVFYEPTYGYSTTEMGSAVYDLFGSYSYSGGSQDRIPESRKNLSDTVFVPRIVSVWDEHPIGTTGLALIAMQVKGQRVDRVSVSASGYVKDWDGSGWNTWTTTSNPAPHFRDILAGDLNFDPLPTALIDDADLVTWRSDCTTKGYTCNLVVEGARAGEALGIVAGCGYARPYMSEIWGVIRDRDRTGDSPVQVFTPRNSQGFSFRRAFANLPDGIRANYIPAGAFGKQSQVIVYRNTFGAPTAEGLQQLSYTGLTSLADVQKRAAFDLKQIEHRSTFYELTASVESIRCRRGDLVGVQHDILLNRSGYGRITAVTLDGLGDISAITLDHDATIYDNLDMLNETDMQNVADMLMVGVKTGIAVRRTDGSITTHAVSNSAGVTNNLTFSPSIPYATVTGGPFDGPTIPSIDVGCLVAIGDIGAEYVRLLVAGIEPGEDYTAKLTLVDEAPEIWS